MRQLLLLRKNKTVSVRMLVYGADAVQRNEGKSQSNAKMERLVALGLISRFLCVNSLSLFSLAFPFLQNLGPTVMNYILNIPTSSQSKLSEINSFYKAWCHPASPTSLEARVIVFPVKLSKILVRILFIEIYNISNEIPGVPKKSIRIWSTLAIRI